MARQPTRERGARRVATLLDAAAHVFAEHGYAAATMTRIAECANAPIGSLYQFFPNKEVLAAALLQRYLDLTTGVLDRIAARAPALSAEALAATLLAVFADLREQRAAALAILDAQGSGARAAAVPFRDAVLARLAAIVAARAPRIAPARRAAIAAALLLQMKAAVRIDDHVDGSAARAAVLRELRAMVGGYFAQL